MTPRRRNIERTPGSARGRRTNSRGAGNQSRQTALPSSLLRSRLNTAQTSNTVNSILEPRILTSESNSLSNRTEPSDATIQNSSHSAAVNSDNRSGRRMASHNLDFDARNANSNVSNRSRGINRRRANNRRGGNNSVRARGTARYRGNNRGRINTARGRFTARRRNTSRRISTAQSFSRSTNASTTNAFYGPTNAIASNRLSFPYDNAFLYARRIADAARVNSLNSTFNAGLRYSPWPDNFGYSFLNPPNARTNAWTSNRVTSAANLISRFEEAHQLNNLNRRSNTPLRCISCRQNIETSSLEAIHAIIDNLNKSALYLAATRPKPDAVNNLKRKSSEEIAKLVSQVLENHLPSSSTHSIATNIEPNESNEQLERSATQNAESSASSAANIQQSPQESASSSGSRINTNRNVRRGCDCSGNCDCEPAAYMTGHHLSNVGLPILSMLDRLINITNPEQSGLEDTHAGGDGYHNDPDLEIINAVSESSESDDHANSANAENS